MIFFLVWEFYLLDWCHSRFIMAADCVVLAGCDLVDEDFVGWWTLEL